MLEISGFKDDSRIAESFTSLIGAGVGGGLFLMVLIGIYICILTIISFAEAL